MSPKWHIFVTKMAGLIPKVYDFKEMFSRRRSSQMVAAYFHQPWLGPRCLQWLETARSNKLLLAAMAKRAPKSSLKRPAAQKTKKARGKADKRREAKTQQMRSLIKQHPRLGGVKRRGGLIPDSIRSRFDSRFSWLPYFLSIFSWLHHT